MQKTNKKKKKKNSKLSPESPYSILHIASVSPCIIFAIQTVRLMMKWQLSNLTKNREQWWWWWWWWWIASLRRDEPWRTHSVLYTSHYTTLYRQRCNVQEREQTKSKAFMLGFLAFQGCILALRNWQTIQKGIVKVLSNHKLKRERKKIHFVGPKPGYLYGAKSFLCTCPHYKCWKKCTATTWL